MPTATARALSQPGRGRRPRVLLADDHALVLEGLTRLLEPECEVAGMVEDGRSLVEAAVRLRPEVILVDISMPLLNGIEAARRLKKLLASTRLIFLTVHADPAYAAEAFSAGASGYLLKRSGAAEVMEAIRRVMRGQVYVSPFLPEPVREALRRPARRPPRRKSLLSPRLRDVLELVAEGKSAKEMARTLGISVKTVEYHKSQLTAKLGIKTVAGLTRYAIAQHIVHP